MNNNNNNNNKKKNNNGGLAKYGLNFSLKEEGKKKKMYSTLKKKKAS